MPVRIRNISMKPVFVTVASHHDIYLDAGSVSGVLPDEVAADSSVASFVTRRMLKVEKMRGKARVAEVAKTKSHRKSAKVAKATAPRKAAKGSKAKAPRKAARVSKKKPARKKAARSAKR